MVNSRTFTSLIIAVGLVLPSLGATAAGTGRPAAAKVPISRRAAPTKSAGHPDLTVAKITPPLVVPTKEILTEAQPLKLKGWVTDANSKPLPGATVWLTGSRQQIAVTNVSGEFVLVLPDDSPVTLNIGYGGYGEEVVKLNHPRTQNGLMVELAPLAKRP